MNDLFRNVTIENYLELVNSFGRSKEIFWDQDKMRLVHPGEYGVYREELLIRFLRLYIPEKFGISSGFIITADGSISHQCDIIVYDKERTPKIQNTERQRFFPIETVLGVIEVKSTIKSIAELNGHLIKLSKLKTFRRSVQDPTPYKRGVFESSYAPDHIFSDNIFTFLMCYDFNFALNPTDINYGDVDQKLWHNMVLSLKDGLLSYQFHETKNLYFSFGRGNQHQHWFLKKDNAELPQCVNLFLSGISFFVNNGALLEIHMERYLTNQLCSVIE